MEIGAQASLLLSGTLQGLVPYKRMECEIFEKLPSAEEYNRLRQLVGWDIYEPEVIVRALPQTLYCVCTLMNETIIGMARIIGDGGLVYYIQEDRNYPDQNFHMSFRTKQRETAQNAKQANCHIQGI